MVSNKDRLYVTLYARTQPRTYHWALTRSPKHEPEGDDLSSTRYHVRNNPDGRGGQVWEYERRSTRSRSTYNTLVRIFVGKIEPRKIVDLENILKDVEIIPK